MKVTAQVLCEINKVIIDTPFEKFHMEYNDLLGIDLFVSLLLSNSFQMADVANKKLEPPLENNYGKELALFIVDGKFYDTIEVSLSDNDIDTSMSKITEKLSSRNGKLCLVD